MVYKLNKLIVVLRNAQMSDTLVLNAREKYGRPLKFVSEDIEDGSIYNWDSQAYENREELGLPHS